MLVHIPSIQGIYLQFKCTVVALIFISNSHMNCKTSSLSSTQLHNFLPLASRRRRHRLCRPTSQTYCNFGIPVVPLLSRTKKSWLHITGVVIATFLHHSHACVLVTPQSKKVGSTFQYPSCTAIFLVICASSSSRARLTLCLALRHAWPSDASVHLAPITTNYGSMVRFQRSTHTL